MSIRSLLATSLGRRDETPNQELAKIICTKNDMSAVAELIDLLQNGQKDIQSDSIKVLYEIGAINPKLISGYLDVFIKTLQSKNNRLQWGAMTALHYMTPENPKGIYKNLIKILETADRGSVITKDHCIGILIELCKIKEYNKHAFTFLIDRLAQSPTNQLPMYAEQAVAVINSTNKKEFIKTLHDRLHDVEKDSKKKRIEKIIKKLG